MWRRGFASPWTGQSPVTTQTNFYRNLGTLEVVMGLLDGLENQALGNILGRSSNPLASGLLQMIQNQPGGLQG